ncbi:Putative effector of murein hydrolase [Lentibacillus halodurans]|uniref:Putative effector of murein hydrolase n=1 Tax=Lentibacillus halodurans TaxID=237679 RepID=A0A1I0WM50_9BACI|nr:LrgB family protein [Lentibacillus halodurans]SFA89457.1 Putative effector of murein hydrolase [Lentibacillus halodurans]
MIHLIANTVAFITITVACYLIGLNVYRKYNIAWLNPLFTSSVLMIALLCILPLQEQSFQSGSMIFNLLLQLAVVSLAVPLYKQWPFMKKNAHKIFTGVLSGTVSGVIVVLGMSYLFHLPEQILASLIPRSVTLPIALTVSSDLGGLASTTVLFVIMSALISLTIGPKLLNKLGITSKSAKGLAMGTSAQMLGANRSLVWGEEEGAMGSIAMTTSALLLSVSAPLFTFISQL